MLLHQNGFNFLWEYSAHMKWIGRLGIMYFNLDMMNYWCNLLEDINWIFYWRNLAKRSLSVSVIFFLCLVLRARYYVVYIMMRHYYLCSMFSNFFIFRYLDTLFWYIEIKMGIKNSSSYGYIYIYNAIILVSFIILLIFDKMLEIFYVEILLKIIIFPRCRKFSPRYTSCASSHEICFLFFFFYCNDLEI